MLPFHDDPNDPFNRGTGDDPSHNRGTGGGDNPPTKNTPSGDLNDPGGQLHLPPIYNKTHGSGKRRSASPGSGGTGYKNTIVPKAPGVGGDDTPPPKLMPRQIVLPEARTFTYNARNTPLSIIYGEVHNVKLSLSYWKVLADGRLVLRYDIGYGPINAVNNMVMDGVAFPNAFGIPAWNGTVGWEIRLGTPTQAVSAAFTATIQPLGWTPTIYPGVAYIAMVIPWPAPVSTSNSRTAPVPDVTNFQADIQGLLIRDPRLDPTLVTRYFNSNPALIIADLVTATRYGGKRLDSQVNWSRITTETAPFHDFDIGGGVKRHTLNIVLQTTENLEDTLENLRAHAQLYISYNSGMIDIIADMVRAPSSIVFTDDDLLEGAKIRQKGSSEVFSHIEVDFTDSANNWTTGNPAEAELQGVALRTREYVDQTFSLLGITTFDQARRIAIYLINRGVQDKELTFSTKQIGIKALPGDVVTISSVEMNLVNQQVLVTDINPVNGTWEYKAEIYSASVYSDVIQNRTVVVSPANPSPHDPTADALDPTSIVITPASPAYISPSSRISFSYVQPVTQFFETVEVYVEFDSGSGYGPKTLWTEAPSSPFTMPQFLGVGNYRLTFVTRTNDGTTIKRSPGVVVVYSLIAPAVGTTGYSLVGNTDFNATPVNLSLGDIGQVTRGRVWGWTSGVGAARQEYIGLTTNALWTGAVWNRDDIAKTAWLAQIDPVSDTFSIAHAAAAANPISWSNFFHISAGGNVAMGQAALSWARLTVGAGGTGSQTEHFFIDSGSTSSGPECIFGLNGIAKCDIDLENAVGGGHFIVGDVQGDMIHRNSTGGVAGHAFSVDGGLTLHSKMTTSSYWPGVTFSIDLGQEAQKWRALYASELRVETLVAQNTISTIGGRILIGPTTKLNGSLPIASTFISLTDNSLAIGDIIYLETAPGGVQQIEFMKINGAPSAFAGGWVYAVVRDLDATGQNNWQTGDAAFNTGQTGAGFIDLYSVRGTKASTEKGPTIVGNVRNSATFNDWSPRWAIGNLNGLYGYATDTYGVAMGVPTGAWVKIDPTNGVRIGFNATTNVQIDAAGNASFTGAVTATSGSFTGAVTASSGTIGGFTIGATTLSTANMVITSSATIGSITFGAHSLLWQTAGSRLYYSGAFACATSFLSEGWIQAVTDITTATGSYFVGSNKVVGARGAAITAPAATIADCQRAINDIISRLSSAAGHGLIT